MAQRALSFRVFALCVTTACVNLLAACGHDDGGRPGDSVPTARWARTYGEASTDVANSVQPTADGGYILAGSTSPFGARDTDARVLKLDANGAIPGCALIASSGATSVAGSATEYDADTLVAPGTVSLVSHTAVSVESTAVASEQCRNE